MAIRNKKKISWFSAITFLIIAGGFVAGFVLTKTSLELRSKATNTGPTLAIIPDSTSLTVGGSATLGISINTHEDTVSAAQLHLTYDPSSVQVLSFDPQTALPVVLEQASFANGDITVTLGANPDQPLKGSAIIGNITIKLLTDTSSTISFAEDTIVAALGKDTNTLAGATGTQVTTASGTEPTPTPTQTQSIADFNHDGKVGIIDYTMFMQRSHKFVSIAST